MNVNNNLSFIDKLLLTLDKYMLDKYIMSLLFYEAFYEVYCLIPKCIEAIPKDKD